MTVKPSDEYIVTIRQLATIVAKCHGDTLWLGDGPLVDAEDIEVDGRVDIHQLVRCRDCKLYREYDAYERTWRTSPSVVKYKAHMCAIFDVDLGENGFCSRAIWRDDDSNDIQ